jgi:hypothetical protein
MERMLCAGHCEVSTVCGTVARLLRLQEWGPSFVDDDVTFHIRFRFRVQLHGSDLVCELVAGYLNSLLRCFHVVFSYDVVKHPRLQLWCDSDFAACEVTDLR